MSEAHIRIAVVRLDRAIPFPEANDSVFKGPSLFQGSLTPKCEESKKKNQSRTRSRSAIPTNTNYHPTRPPHTHETGRLHSDARNSIPMLADSLSCVWSVRTQTNNPGTQNATRFPPNSPQGCLGVDPRLRVGGVLAFLLLLGSPFRASRGPTGPRPQSKHLPKSKALPRL